jgi:SAM-dependent methyltransferase
MADATPPLSVDDVVSMAQPRGLRILDVGCGDGELGAALLAAGAAEVVGLDACARGLTRARLTSVVRAAADGMPELPWPDGYFDLLVIEDLSALVAPAPALQHLRRWLADQGRVVAVAPNSTHEAALVALLGTGHWPAGAGWHPSTFEGALEALRLGGFAVQDDMMAIRTDPGPAAQVLKQLAEALGAEGPRIEDGLTLVRAILVARPAEPRGLVAQPLADPWAGSKPVKVLITPDVGETGWLEALRGLAHGLSGNAGVTIGVAVPLATVTAPPPELSAAVEGAEVDLLLTEAPTDEDGWTRLMAGASTWIQTAHRQDLRATALRVGVDVQSTT